ncbi:MAG: protein translocase subunit SecD [Phycisphaerales bacterium]
MQLLFYTLILPLLLAGYVFAVRKNFPPLRRAVVDTVVIAATCVLMFLQLLPPEQKIKLGRDLRGGVSLIYSVNTPAGANKQEVLSQTIKVLKNRVNPQGVLDLSMAPQGEDRIEIVMPLPGQEVRAQQKAYREALDALLRHAHLTPRELDQALAQGKAAELAGDDAARRATLETLQRAYVASKEARAAYDAAEAAKKTGPELDELAGRAAAAAVDYDRARAAVQTGALSASRFTRIVALPTKSTKPGTPAEREAALDELRKEFPSCAKEIDAVVALYDAYTANRTPLDDPEDLKRLLRGAGVLDFRIAVTTDDSAGVNIPELRKQLAEGGPMAAESPVVRWFRVNDLAEWYENAQQLAALQADPASYFASTRKLVAGAGPDKQVYLLLWTTPDRSLVHETGSKEWSIKQVGRTVDQLGRAAVSFQLDDQGGNDMGRLTGANVGKPMAIVLDNQVYTAPNLQSKISDSGQITGNFDEKQIDYLVRVLASGSLGARLSPEPVSVSVLGPAMGADNLDRGLRSVLISVPVTFAVMILYYFVPGLIANVSLLINALIIFFAMSLVDGSFTLPGLAGIALNLGIAVDSNVLIYERLREELVDHKQSLLDAIETAMHRAATAIIDGNMTHLIVIVVLYWFAGAEVKGFALVMGIGVFSTLAAGLIVTHVLLRLYALGTGAKSISMLPIAIPALSRALRPNIDWLRFRHVFWGGSLAFGVVCVLATVWRGVDIFETEFRGGTTMTMATRMGASGERTADNGRLLLARPAVEERLRQIGNANASDPILSEFRNATALTVGESTANAESTSFQIKIPNPVGIADESQVAPKMVAAVVDAFKDDMDIRRPVTFAGLGDKATGGRTYRIDHANLDEVLGRPSPDVPLDEAMGGVVVLFKDVNPPLAPADVAERIRRLRSQPDFSDVAGRTVDVVGIDPAGEGVYSTLAVVVGDPDLAGRKVSDASWQKNYADVEWRLASSALSQQATLEQVSSISGAVARDLAAQAAIAVVISFIGMLIYIWVRFGSLLYSAATVIGVVFNVAVCLGMLAMSKWLGETSLGHLLRIQDFRIDLNVVSGLLIVIGYSLNDTIVILDRVRENRGKLPYATRPIINDSINQTFSRTLLTGGCTAATPIVLYLVGGPSMEPFAYTFLVGLIAGTYSSNAIAATLVYVPGDGTPEQAGGPASDTTAARPAAA